MLLTRRGENYCTIVQLNWRFRHCRRSVAFEHFFIFNPNEYFLASPKNKLVTHAGGDLLRRIRRPGRALAQAFTLLHSFNTAGEGAYPDDTLVLSNGVLYGVTSSGGGHWSA